MTLTFYRYGLAPFDELALSAEEQAAVTKQEFLRQLAAGELPADAVDGGFVADPERPQSQLKFLQRAMGAHIAMRCQPGDRICVTSFDRLMCSADTRDTLDWARMRDIGLIFIGQKIDTSTPHGREFIELLAELKGNDRRDIGRKIRARNKRRRELGLVTSGGQAPLGYQTKLIVPLGGGKPMKYYMPWEEERQYGELIVKMHDEMGLSYRRIAVKFWTQNVRQPRSGLSASHHCNIIFYYKRCKQGWPLPGGVAWKPPQFEYRLAKPRRVIDFNKVSA